MTLREIAKDIYYTPFDTMTDRPNLGYIGGSRFSLMFDAGASPAHAADYFATVRAAGLKRPALCAISHAHWDHAYGMHALDFPIIAGAKTNALLDVISQWEWSDEAMRERLEKKMDVLFGFVMLRNEYKDVIQVKVTKADIIFSGELELDLGGLSCRLLEVGGPHADDSVVCFIPERKLIFLSDSPGKKLDPDMELDPMRPDLIEEAWAKLPFDQQKLDGYRAALEPLDFEICLSGHSEPMSKQQLFNEVLVQTK